MKPFSFLALLLCIHALSVFAQDFFIIDKHIQNAIKTKVFPSANLIIANSKKVLYSKVYGTFAYDFKNPTLETSFYDIAALTKVVATVPAIMRLYEAKKIDLNDPVVKHLPNFNNHGKDDITILNLLLHNSGLPANKDFYRYVHSPLETLAEIYYMEKEYPTGTKTVYSEIGFVILSELVDKVAGIRLDRYVKQEIFHPLEMFRTLYQPLDDLKSQCIPTEDDQNWRHRLVQGTVHDELAAVLNGVSGNAGLFSVATDLAKYMRMWLNNGMFADSRGVQRQLFKKDTIELFTKKWTNLPYENARALGWDTKPDGAYGPPCGNFFSENSFGHVGLTGTSIWADKEKDLIVILLTNSINPNRKNASETMSQFRPFIHDEICKVMGYTSKPKGFLKFLRLGGPK